MLSLKELLLNKMLQPLLPPPLLKLQLVENLLLVLMSTLKLVLVVNLLLGLVKQRQLMENLLQLMVRLSPKLQKL